MPAFEALKDKVGLDSVVRCFRRPKRYGDTITYTGLKKNLVDGDIDHMIQLLYNEILRAVDIVKFLVPDNYFTTYLLRKSAYILIEEVNTWLNEEDCYKRHQWLGAFQQLTNNIRDHLYPINLMSADDKRSGTI